MQQRGIHAAIHPDPPHTRPTTTLRFDGHLTQDLPTNQKVGGPGSLRLPSRSRQDLGSVVIRPRLDWPRLDRADLRVRTGRPVRDPCRLVPVARGDCLSGQC
jgi:hypothetical protein